MIKGVLIIGISLVLLISVVYFVNSSFLKENLITGFTIKEIENNNLKEANTENTNLITGNVIRENPVNKEEKETQQEAFPSGPRVSLNVSVEVVG